MKEENELIITIVNKGQSDSVVSSAREAGATGGTILNGRGTFNQDNNSILGINLKAEKEIIFTIVPSSKKKKIMEQISNRVNLNLDGSGICFSLPINTLIAKTKINKTLKK